MSDYMEHRRNVLLSLAVEARANGREEEAKQLEESAKALRTMIDQLDACVARNRELKRLGAKND